MAPNEEWARGPLCVVVATPHTVVTTDSCCWAPWGTGAPPPPPEGGDGCQPPRDREGSLQKRRGDVRLERGIKVGKVI